MKNFKERKNLELEIREVPHKIFNYILYYLYNDYNDDYFSKTSDYNFAISLIQYSKFFSLNRLAQIIEKNLANNLNEKNVLHILLKSSFLGSLYLEICALEFLAIR